MTPRDKAFFEYGRIFEATCRRAELLRTARKRYSDDSIKYGPALLMARVLFNRTKIQPARCAVGCQYWEPRKEEQNND